MHPSHPSQWLYFFKLSIGMVWIAHDPNGNGRFWLGFEDEGLGSYYKPWQAAEDAALGYSGYPKLDQFVNARRLAAKKALPEDVREWNRGALLVSARG